MCPPVSHSRCQKKDTAKKQPEISSENSIFSDDAQGRAGGQRVDSYPSEADERGSKSVPKSAVNH